MGPFFVDFEAFQHGEEDFHIKELCIIDADIPLDPCYFIFGPHKPWDRLTSEQKTTYSFQSRALHHLDYNEGLDVFCTGCVSRAIKKQFYPGYRNGIFYVMGEQKLRYMKDILPEFNWCEYNLTVEQLPPLIRNIGCLHRPHDVTHCACLKALKLYQHYIHLSVM